MDFESNVKKLLEKHIQEEGWAECSTDCFCHKIKNLLKKDNEVQKEIIRCQDCHESDDTVDWTNCPYQHDINGVDERILVCSRCYYDRLDSI